MHLNILLVLSCISCICTTTYGAKYQWQQVGFSNSSAQPSRTCGHATGLDEGTLLLFGGCDTVCCRAPSLVLWAYNIGAETWEVIPQNINPPQRVYHSLSAVDGTTFPVVLWGGIGSFIGTFLQDMWMLKPPNYQWTPLYPDSAWPDRRGAHSGVLIRNSTDDIKLLVYGGRDAAKVYSDHWCYSFRTNQWIQFDASSQDTITPGSRAFHSAVVYKTSPTLAFVLLFGGTNGQSVCMNDLWSFDVQKGSWKQLQPEGVLPPARVGHQATINYIDGMPLMWVFGGQDCVSGVLNDSWVYDITLMTWSKTVDIGTKASPRAYFSVSVLNSKTNVLFGGYSESNSTNGNNLGQLLGDMWLVELIGQ